MPQREPTVENSFTTPWVNKNNPHGEPLSFQVLAEDPDTGMTVQHIIYRAGTVTRTHRHSCSHGIYVLSGTLMTDRGPLGPGSMVWFPAGCVMTHGATEAEDVEVLFITNKTFDIEYL